jgi:chemotaxis protein CheD
MSDPVRRAVGIAELRVSADPGEVLVTYALGSCLGICVYDPVARVGGMLHAMLPESSIDPEKAREKPGMFIDTGVPRLFRRCYRLGAVKARMRVTVAGGASSRADGEADHFQVGRRNLGALRELLRRNGVALHGHDVGGVLSRTISLRLEDGVVVVRMPGVPEYTL